MEDFFKVIPSCVFSCLPRLQFIRLLVFNTSTRLNSFHICLCSLIQPMVKVHLAEVEILFANYYQYLAKAEEKH